MRYSRHVQVEKNLNEYIMSTGRDFGVIEIDGTDYDVFETLARIKTELIKRKKMLEKEERDKEEQIKSQRSFHIKSLPKFQHVILEGEENFLQWIRNYENLKEQIGSSDELKLVTLIKSSLGNKEDVRITQAMSSLNDILKYLYKKYLNSSSLLHSTLKPVMNLLPPRNMKDCIKNIEETLNIIQVLVSNNVIEQIDDSRLTKIETKCLTKQGLIEYYQAKALAKNLSDSGRGDMSLVDLTMADRMGMVLPGASSTAVTRTQVNYCNLSFKDEVKKLIDAESIEFKRNFFIEYIEKKLETFRSAMAAERTAESKLAEVQIKEKAKVTFKKQERSFGTQEQSSFNRKPRGPLKECPFNCGQRHEWGSGALCATFRAVEDEDESLNLVKTFGITKCCVKKIKHTPDKPCRAKLCECGSPHH